jgi:hypothetical protein
MAISEEVLNYKIIRQPYRITMAKWDFTVTQKRILTKIISLLQREISLVAKGMPVGQLEIFSNVDDSIKLTFSLNDIVKNSNNYTHVKKALQELRSFDVQIILPATKSKTSRKPEEETILTGLIERAVLTKHSRNVTIVIHKATAQELVKATNGLTQFAEEIMYLTDNSYTQKLYEMISHWKDKEVFSISPEDFRERLSLMEKYPQIKDLIRRVIKPAETELKEIADVFFVFNTSTTGRKITKFNFVIKHKKTLHEDELNQLRLRDDNIHLLKAHLGFRTEHIQSIADILSRNELIGVVRNKIIELYTFIQEAGRSPQTAIKKVPEYVIQSLKNEFDK